VGPDLQYVRASSNPASPVEPYEFAIAVRLDNTKKDEESEEGSDLDVGGAP
jgi:hypothetical protein